MQAETAEVTRDEGGGFNLSTFGSRIVKKKKKGAIRKIRNKYRIYNKSRKHYTAFQRQTHTPAPVVLHFQR